MSAQSPSLSSPTSESSFDYVSARSQPGSPSFSVVSDNILSSDGDQIVWSGMSDFSSFSMSPPISQPRSRARSPAASDDDFIVLSRAMSPSRFSTFGNPDATRAIEDELSAAISSLTIAQAGSSVSLNVHRGAATRFDIKRALNISAEAFTAAAATAKSPTTPKFKKKAVPVPASRASPTAAEKTAKEGKKAKKAAKLARQQAKTQQRPPSTTSNSSGSTSLPASPSRRERARARAAVSSTAASTPAPAATTPVTETSNDSSDSAVLYKDAVEYVNSHLSNPTSNPGGYKNLKLLQAMIIELGLCPSALRSAPSNSAPFASLPSLPHSLRAARALIKTNVFLNVRDYLAVRSQGLDALRRVMHPTRTSLIREVRSGKRMPVKEVKKAGLNALLVQCF